ncbi:hypothetical protein ARMGADRAFT_1035964 [Armillaria gallica]|uniref:Uncharacterized protein n=1 Tax=Armillaria gallica TaxID=47427 RepID=A0A2H3D5B8_ARMGA|nr:hypothetical protein ARMGADRAFT_1035964 [Armillaria gallica]
MPSQVVVNLQPSTNEFPGGGEIHEHHGPDSTFVERIFYPTDPARMAERWGPDIAPQLLCGSKDPANYAEALAEVGQYITTWVALFKLFPFMSTLNIRVWDSWVSALGRCLFGLDFVDMDGQPQHVGDAVRVMVGKRGTPGGFEVEGNPVLPIEAAVGEDDEEYFEVFAWRGEEKLKDICVCALALGEGLTGRKVRRQYEYDFRTLQKEEETSHDLPGSMGPLCDDRTLRKLNELPTPSGLSRLFSLNLTRNSHDSGMSKWYAHASDEKKSMDTLKCIELDPKQDHMMKKAASSKVLQKRKSARSTDILA